MTERTCFDSLLLTSASLVLYLILCLSNQYRLTNQFKDSFFSLIWFFLFDHWPSWIITSSKQGTSSHRPYSTLTMLFPVVLITYTYSLLSCAKLWEVEMCVQRGIRLASHSTIWLVICWIIHSFKKYILNLWNVPGTVLGTWSTAINRHISCHHWVYSLPRKTDIK